MGKKELFREEERAGWSLLLPDVSHVMHEYEELSELRNEVQRKCYSMRDSK